MRPSRKLLLATIIFLVVVYFWIPFRWWNPIASVAISGWFIYLVIERLREPPPSKTLRQRIEWTALGLLILILGVLLLPDELPVVGWMFYGCTGLYLLLRGIR